PADKATTSFLTCAGVPRASHRLRSPLRAMCTECAMEPGRVHTPLRGRERRPSTPGSSNHGSRPARVLARSACALARPVSRQVPCGFGDPWGVSLLVLPVLRHGVADVAIKRWDQIP